MRGCFYHNGVEVGVCRVIWSGYRAPIPVDEGIASTPGYFAKLADVRWNSQSLAAHPRSLVLEFMCDGLKYVMTELRVLERIVEYGGEAAVVVFSPGFHMQKLNGLERASREACQKTQLQRKTTE